jgi:hypothetical protein
MLNRNNWGVSLEIALKISEAFRPRGSESASGTIGRLFRRFLPLEIIDHETDVRTHVIKGRMGIVLLDGL